MKPSQFQSRTNVTRPGNGLGSSSDPTQLNYGSSYLICLDQNYSNFKQFPLLTLPNIILSSKFKISYFNPLTLLQNHFIPLNLKIVILIGKTLTKTKLGN